MAQVGDKLPNVNITVIDKEGQKSVAANEYFAGKKAVLFALPGASRVRAWMLLLVYRLTMLL